MDKGSGSGIFPDPGDPKRPDPDPQHWSQGLEETYAGDKERYYFRREGVNCDEKDVDIPPNIVVRCIDMYAENHKHPYNVSSPLEGTMPSLMRRTRENPTAPLNPPYAMINCS